MRKIITAVVAGAAATTGLVLGTAPASASASSAHPVPACSGSAIRSGHNHPQGAAGHGNVVLRFRNISKHTCSLRGYPGADALGKHGGTLAHAKRTLHGYTGGAKSVRTVVLEPNAVASADLEWQNIPDGSGTCTFSHSIAVTPANTSRTAHFALSVSLCKLEVHPTVAGTTGNSAH